MKHLLLSGLLFTAITCQSNTIDVNSTDISSTNNNIRATETIAGNWQLQPVLASDTASGKIPTLNFDLLHHKFTGNTGCNSMSGSFVLKGDALSFAEQIIITRMACPGYNEKAFLENFTKTNRYQIKNGTLQLMYNTTILSNWVRHADTATTKRI
jgi:heat shock protein HslJ